MILVCWLRDLNEKYGFMKVLEENIGDYIIFERRRFKYVIKGRNYIGNWINTVIYKLNRKIF